MYTEQTHLSPVIVVTLVIWPLRARPDWVGGLLHMLSNHRTQRSRLVRHRRLPTSFQFGFIHKSVVNVYRHSQRFYKSDNGYQVVSAYHSCASRLPSSNQPAAKIGPARSRRLTVAPGRSGRDPSPPNLPALGPAPPRLCWTSGDHPPGQRGICTRATPRWARSAGADAGRWRRRRGP